MKTLVTLALCTVIIGLFTKGLFTPRIDNPALSFAVKFVSFVAICLVIAGYAVALCLI